MSANDRELSRRDLLRAAAAAGALVWTSIGSEAAQVEPPILDAHVHVWDLKQFHLPWLDHGGPPLARDYPVADYVAAAEGLNIVAAVYVEVNVEPGQRAAEADYVTGLVERANTPFTAGVVAGDPRESAFAEFLNRYKDRPAIRGVRYLYPGGGSDDPSFVRGIRALGDRRLSFDLQLGPDLLSDAARLAESCRDTHFILDHCGGVEPRAFRREFANDSHARGVREAWRRGMEALARHPNVACKISGVADAALPGVATAEDVAPVVNSCLDQFGPDRVLFGGNWPVCLKAATLRHWVESLRAVVANRTAGDRRKLFHDNAVKVYRISGPDKARPQQ